MPDEHKPAASRFQCWLVPELRHFRSTEEMRDLQRAIRKRRQGRSLLVLLAISSAVSIPMTVLVRSNWSGTAAIIPTIFIVGGGAVIASILYVAHEVRQNRPIIRNFLQERGIPICVACGYDLKGQTEPRCPECGEAFDAKLVTRGVDPRPQ